MDAQGASELDGGAGCGDDTGDCRAYVGCVDVHADCYEVFAAVHTCGEGAEGLCKDHVSAAVQQTDGLSVTGDGHGRHGAFCGEFLELNAHGGDELAQAAGEVRVQVLGDAALGQLCLDFFCGEGGGCCRADGCVLCVVFSHDFQCTPWFLLLWVG